MSPLKLKLSDATGREEREPGVRCGEFVAGKFQMLVLPLLGYTADAEVAKSARLRVVFSCIDDTRMESVECIVARMSKWPDGDKMHIEL